MQRETRKIKLNGYAKFNRAGFTQTFIDSRKYIDMKEIVTELNTITIHLDREVPGKEEEGDFSKTYTSDKGFSTRKIFGLINDIQYDFEDYCTSYYNTDQDDTLMDHLTIIGFKIVGGTDVYPMIDS